METKEIFDAVNERMQCDQILTIGKKDTYDKDEGFLKNEIYFLTYLNKGAKCSLTFKVTYE